MMLKKGEILMMMLMLMIMLMVNQMLMLMVNQMRKTQNLLTTLSFSMNHPTPFLNLILRGIIVQQLLKNCLKTVSMMKSMMNLMMNVKFLT